MQAASSHRHLSAAHRPPRSCLKKSSTKKQHTVRFALPDEPPRGSSKLLPPPPRAFDLGQELNADRWQPLAGCIKPAARQMWLACGVLGTYHTLLQPSGARMAILGMCFVLPATRTLAAHGVRQSVARLLPPNPMEYLMATAAASAGIYVGLNGKKI